MTRSRAGGEGECRRPLEQKLSNYSVTTLTPLVTTLIPSVTTLTHKGKYCGFEEKDNRDIDVPCEWYLYTNESREMHRGLCSRLCVPGATAKYLAVTEERPFSRKHQ